MAAVAHASPADIRHLALVRIGSYVPPAAIRTPVSVYRRRRLVAVLIVASVLAVVVLAVGPLLASFGTGPVPGTGRSGPPVAVYVVQPGDTFWEIARRVEPGGDPRPLVARMVAAHGSPVLVAGERLVLPAAT